METQGKLLDVPISQAQSEAEHYAEMAAFIRQKQEELKAQADIVIKAMEESEQRKLSFVDTYGVRHTFEFVEAHEKLKYTKAREARSKTGAVEEDDMGEPAA
jgi:hypothetical protein